MTTGRRYQFPIRKRKPLDPIFDVATRYGRPTVPIVPAVKNLTISGSVTHASLNGAEDVVYGGGYCYVASGLYDGVSVVDVSVPSVPVVVGSVTNSTYMNNAHGIAKTGNYVVVCADLGANGTLAVVDVSVPSAPSVVGTLSDATMNGAFDVCLSVDGNTAYVAASTADRLVVVDITTKTAPSILGSVTHADLDLAQGVSLVDSTHVAVAGGNSNKLVIVNVSVPSAPTISGSVTWSGANPLKVAMQGAYAYVTNFTDTVKVIDVSNVATPTVAGSITLANSNPNWKCQPSGTGWAAVTSYDSLYLAVIDIAVPTAPVFLDELTDAGLDQALGCAVNDPYIYVACYQSNRLIVASWA